MNPWENAPPEILTLATFLNYFYKESDRGAALLAGSMLDEILGRLLRAHLIAEPESDKLLTGFNAPLGTFNARIIAAYCLGLIERLEFKEANTIRKIRNKFAHTWGDLSLDDVGLKPLIDALPLEQNTDEAEGLASASTRFKAAVANLHGEWLWRESLVRQDRCRERVWPHKSGFIKRNT